MFITSIGLYVFSSDDVLLHIVYYLFKNEQTQSFAVIDTYLFFVEIEIANNRIVICS